MDRQTLASEAARHLASGMTCSQAVVSVFSDRYDISPEAALQAASGFAGGVGMSGNVCGAACGGAMILGLEFAPNQPGNKKALATVFAKTQEFLARFTEIHGSKLCSQITGIDDMTAPDVSKRFQEDENLRNKCLACVQGATTILADMLPQKAS